MDVGDEVCNCYATNHAFLTNCISCGWICCINNKSGKCGYCKNDLTVNMSINETIQSMSSTDSDPRKMKAYQLVQKLLVFDKENTIRTSVHDAQGDYYESSGSMWLTEDEKKEIMRREALRKEKSKRVQDRRIDIRFDLEGRRVVNCTVDDIDAYDPYSPPPPAVAADYDDGLYSTLKAFPPSSGMTSSMETSIHGDANVDASAASNLPAYENTELELDRNKAGDVYRYMKRR